MQVRLADVVDAEADKAIDALHVRAPMSHRMTDAWDREVPLAKAG